MFTNSAQITEYSNRRPLKRFEYNAYHDPGGRLRESLLSCVASGVLRDRAGEILRVSLRGYERWIREYRGPDGEAVLGAVRRLPQPVGHEKPVRMVTVQEIVSLVPTLLGRMRSGLELPSSSLWNTRRILEAIFDKAGLLECLREDFEAYSRLTELYYRDYLQQMLWRNGKPESFWPMRAYNAAIENPLLATSSGNVWRLDALCRIWREIDAEVGDMGLDPSNRAHLLSMCEMLPLAVEAARVGSGWVYATDSNLLVIPHPRARFDDNWKFHCEDGPAIEGLEGEEFYFLHGVPVPKGLVTDPQYIKPWRIRSESNEEVGTLMLERYGWQKFLQEVKPTVVDEDTFNGSKRQLLRVRWRWGRPLMVVRQTCPSTGRDYDIRVPPNIRTARGAAAWTFGMGGKSYNPTVET